MDEVRGERLSFLRRKSLLIIIFFNLCVVYHHVCATCMCVNFFSGLALTGIDDSVSMNFCVNL